MARCKLRNARPKAMLGTLIPTAINAIGSIYGAISNNDSQTKMIQHQIDAQNRQTRIQDLSNQANMLNSGVLAANDEYPRYAAYANGGEINKLGGLNILSGYGIDLGNGLILLQGPSHEQGGITIKRGDKTFVAEGNEIMDISRPTETRIISDSLQLGNGNTPVQEVLSGKDPDNTFDWQQSTKKYYGLNDNGTMKQNKVFKNRRKLRDITSLVNPLAYKYGGTPKAKLGAEWNTVDYIGLGTNVLGSLLSKSTFNGNYKKAIDLYNNNPLRGSYMSSPFVNGNTRIDDSATRAAIERSYAGQMLDERRNRASANVAGNAIGTLNTNKINAINELGMQTGNKNAEMRLEQDKLRQANNMQNASNYNEFIGKQGALELERIRDIAGLYDAQRNSNVGLMTSLGESVGNFLQQGIDNYTSRQAKSLLTVNAPNGTAVRIDRNVPGFYDDKDRLGLYRDAYRRYELDPSQNNYLELLHWYDALKGGKYRNKLREMPALQQGIQQPNTPYLPGSGLYDYWGRPMIPQTRGGLQFG